MSRPNVQSRRAGQPVVADPLFGYPKYWAECYGTAPYLPMSRQEMDDLGWDSCDIIIVCGDAYVDHPSFGMAVMGRFLEAQGFRVGIIAQPDWRSAEPFKALGKPNLFFGVSAGNMDSMINRYTADMKVRNDDAYTPDGAPGKRPDRAVTVYSQRCKEAYKDVPVVLGGIEASLRRIAQYDYWSDQVRRSVLFDATADILLYGNAERAIAEVAHELALGKDISELKDIRGTAIIRNAVPGGWTEIDSTRIDWPKHIDAMPNPYDVEDTSEGQCSKADTAAGEAVDEPVRIIPMPLQGKSVWDMDKTCIRLPSFEKVSKDAVLYSHASRVLHQESNPQNARVLVQKHGNHELWVNPPPIPLETDEMDDVFALPYQRRPHPSYGDANIPAYEMIKTSVNIMRGCFGGCTFCSITEHEGRVIQSRSEESVLREIEEIRDKVPGFTGTISDLGGPTANMYHLNCKDPMIHANCRRLSCVFPTICKNLVTDHSPTTKLYRKARQIPGVKRVAIASGLRYDLAVRDPEYVRELVTHHVGGYLKIAPEHSEEGTLNKMMKPGMDTYYSFKRMFDKYSKEAGKEQYLIPYFIAAHPGCEDEDMLNLSLWLKKNKFRVDQVQTFYPSPMSLATAMYHSERDPLHRLSYKSKPIYIPRKLEQRRLQKAFLRYHDPKNWAYLRKALIDMNRRDLIGDGPNQLVPWEEKGKGRQRSGQKRGDKRSSQYKDYNPAIGSQGRSAGDGESSRKTTNQRKPDARKPNRGGGRTSHKGRRR
ncbi:YgiQ family radical SAM protein [Pseudomaricurvus alkylphenolicus]|uniref:YgiQ family radical SAM protein n=1 Tax=Pseudomaricurvus alkylphenolicus TaxID=1306991 RepID=UPI0014217D0E|nr:YgiQ family radical SAM protein [Pseudomaricurvus alkylphenolicus]